MKSPNTPHIGSGGSTGTPALFTASGIQPLKKFKLYQSQQFYVLRPLDTLAPLHGEIWIIVVMPNPSHHFLRGVVQYPRHPEDRQKSPHTFQNQLPYTAGYEYQNLESITIGPCLLASVD